ncbi:MAG: hypothetical protein EU540_01640 [Promethearchaeota archaeon]|nr:MAG: hypothetical protein EU540_01640 [Candidatus Lokiarchaeota archaeon]
MPDVRIKTPNLDDIFERWKTKAGRTQRKQMEKQFGTKGSVFTLEAISAAEYVTPPALKGAAIYFSIKKTIAASSVKEENLVIAPRLGRETFYSFKGSRDIDKDNWKGNEEVPMFESIEPVPCKTCRGNGYIEDKCKPCKGTGKIVETWAVLVGEEQKKEKKTFEYPCGNCYGTGKLPSPCKECGGHKNLYKYEILPVPFKTVAMGIPILHSSLQTKYEKEMGKDLQELIEKVEGIKFSNFKELNNKAEGSLGYWDKNVKKTISASGSDYKTHEKDKDTKIQSQIYLFPMVGLNCKTKKGKKFEIYSIGSAENFMIYSNF